jgi:hypothetical protein
VANFPSAGLTLRDGATLPEVVTFLRQMATMQNRNIADAVRDVAAKETTRQQKNDFQGGTDLYSQEGPVSLRMANRPSPGQVLYAIDSLNAGWGDGTTKAPTDPGTGPLVGAKHNLLDGVYDIDTLAAACV